MNTKKIAVLEKAIGMLENGFDYEWTEMHRCNCGVVVQAMRKSTFTECCQAASGDLWSVAAKKRINDRCSVTGLKIGVIQGVLLNNGFTREDIIHLEYLSDKDILEKSKIRIEKDYEANKYNLILYLRAWVTILKEQDAKETPEVKERIIYVSVPVTISEQAKELITNN